MSALSDYGWSDSFAYADGALNGQDSWIAVAAHSSLPIVSGKVQTSAAGDYESAQLAGIASIPFTSPWHASFNGVVSIVANDLSDLFLNFGDHTIVGTFMHIGIIWAAGGLSTNTAHIHYRPPGGIVTNGSNFTLDPTVPFQFDADYDGSQVTISVNGVVRAVFAANMALAVTHSIAPQIVTSGNDVVSMTNVAMRNT